ncbi:MAG: carboxylating nicotinate-nucleotide diphosphorylase [Acidobacteria bacterium]|nr:MAG: carboxylating nicotinate-nucleotide diphosphorylase [Acidobacteriota bacterium]
MTASSARFPGERAAWIVRHALDEDLGRDGDVTSRATIPAGSRLSARLVAREPCVVAGMPLVALVFGQMAQRLGVEAPSVGDAVDDGTRARAGETLAVIAGDARVVLGGERVLLNLLARLSGIATLTAEAVAEIAGTRTTVADTRKTTPLLRALEKYAVRVGGGENHRETLDELPMVKDNHKLVAGGVREAISALRAAGIDPRDAEVEVDTYDECLVAVEEGAGWILLDNMTPDEVRRCVDAVAGRARIEVSGGLRPGRLRPFAEAGADRLSLGILTHGARAVDLALDVLPAAD